MGTSKKYSKVSPVVSLVIPQEDYRKLYYRKHLLSVPADESSLGRIMWTISARTRRFAVDEFKDLRLKQIKDNIHDYLEVSFDRTMNFSLQESRKLKNSLTDEEFTNGFLGQDWNSHVKYPTVFDSLSEGVEMWHNYHLGVSTIFDRDEWISVTGDKLKWPKRRFGTKDIQKYDRPYAIRRHFPFEDEKNYVDQLLKDAGVFRMLGKDIPEHVRSIDV